MIVYIGADSILLYSGAFSPAKTDERMVTMHDHEKEPIGHALHVLDTTMRRYIDTYSHKKEHENLMGHPVHRRSQRRARVFARY